MFWVDYWYIDAFLLFNISFFELFHCLLFHNGFIFILFQNLCDVLC